MNNTNSIAIYTSSPFHFHVLPTSDLKFIKVTNKAVSITHYNLTSKKKKKIIHINWIQKKKAYIEWNGNGTTIKENENLAVKNRIMMYNQFLTSIFIIYKDRE